MISIHAAVEQVACWVDEQLCARNPHVLELNKMTRLCCAAMFLGLHGRDFIVIKHDAIQATIMPSDVLLKMLDEKVEQLPSRTIETNSPSGSTALDALICFMQLDQFCPDLMEIDGANFVGSYVQMMLPVRNGFMTVGGWNREGRLRFYPTELGRQSGRVSRRRVVLSQIGQHLSRSA